MADEVEELIGFLSSPSPNLRKAAVDIVRDLTGSDDGICSLSSRLSSVLFPALLRLLRDCGDPQVPSSAAEALINLSSHSPQLCADLVAAGAVDAAMDALYGSHGTKLDQRLLVMLLVNLTQTDSGVSNLIQIGDEKMEGLHVSKLVRSFSHSSDNETEGEGPFEHVGSILVNISKTEAGRKLLLEPKRSLLRQIIPQFDSTSLLRKKGVSGMIRNCCFEADNQLQNLLLVSEFLWPALLLPVAGKKVYAKEDIEKMPLELASVLSHEREPTDDPELRIQALESIYLISLQDAGRRSLWSVNGPRILQVGYEDEADPKVMEAFEQIGSLLVSESGAE